MRELSSTGRLFEVGPVDRVLKKVDQIENRVRFASYGYAGFFDAVKIEEPQLDAYTSSTSRSSRRSSTSSARARAAGKGLDRRGPEEAASELESAVDDLNRTFDERYRSIENFRPGDSQGQPMFT